MQRRGKQIAINILSGTLSIFVFLFLFFFLVNFAVDIVFLRTEVRGYSMQPTINITAPNMEVEWDSVYINRYRECVREDIIVANVHWYGNSIIKRLVAVPGDTIRMKENGEYYELYVNERFVRKQKKTTYSTHTREDGTQEYRSGGTEEYFKKYQKLVNNESTVIGDFSSNIITNYNGEKCIKLNEGEYFLMGDNWAETTDSMTHGTVSKTCFVGKVELIVEHNQNTTQAFVAFIWKTLFS